MAFFRDVDDIFILSFSLILFSVIVNELINLKCPEDTDKSGNASLVLQYSFSYSLSFPFSFSLSAFTFLIVFFTFFIILLDFGGFSSGSFLFKFFSVFSILLIGIFILLLWDLH